MDTLSNRSAFISLRFQIDPLWIAHSNVLLFHDRFHRFPGETTMISLCFQMKTYPCNRGLRPHYDNVAFSPPVHMETMKTIMKTQALNTQAKVDQFENAMI